MVVPSSGCSLAGNMDKMEGVRGGEAERVRATRPPVLGLFLCSLGTLV